jgi:CubicO group peptidase (beta-lactamase class C family)
MSDQVDIKGSCSKEFQALQDAFAANFADGLEIGASLCMSKDGETIVDIWGGSADAEGKRPWGADTITTIWSATKIPTIITTLLCIDRGLLDLDTPVATYWPEFSQHGKEKITVREAMTHRARVPGFKIPIEAESIADWDKCVGKIAAEAPWFDDDRICYHALSFGFILGELVQRVTGAPFRQFFNEELAAPLGADVLMGLSNRSELTRVADFLNASPMPHEEDGIGDQVFHSFGAPMESEIWFENWDLRTAVNPAGGGLSNARGMCRLATMMANGGTLNGRTYLSPETINEASTEQYHGVDPMLGNIRLGLGFGLDGSEFPAPTPDAFHWGGYGGSWCFMDTKRRLAGAYVMNNCFVMDDWGEFEDRRMNRFFTAIRSMF